MSISSRGGVNLAVHPHSVNWFIKFNLALYKNKLSQAFWRDSGAWRCFLWVWGSGW